MPRIKIANLGAAGMVKDSIAEDLPPEAFTDVRNARFNALGAVAFSGHRSVFTPASEEMLWIKPFPPVTLPVWVYATQTRLWAYDGLHKDITREVTPYSYSEANRWQGEIFNGVGIFNNGLDVPQAWAGFQADTRLVDLPNWPENLRARWLRTFKNFLIAGWTVEDGTDRPYRVRWSSSAPPGQIPASWALDDPSRDSGEFDLAESPDYLIDGLALGDLFIVYKERTAWAMQYTGDQFVFRNFQILHDRGLLWRDCVQAFPGGHFVVGQDDIYVHYGQRGSERSLVHNRVRKWVFNQLSGTTYYNCYTLLNKENNEVWFCFPEAKETFATLALVWNWNTGAIGIRDLPGAPFMSVGAVDEQSEQDTWGGSEVGGNGWLSSEPAVVNAVLLNTRIGLGALEAQPAVLTAVGQPVQPGWPEFGNDPNFRYFGTVTESGGPISLSEIPLTNLGGQPIPAFNISGKVTLTFAPGVVRTGDFYGDTQRRQSALLLDKLNDYSVVILNLDGAQLIGGASVDEPGFPAVVAPVPLYIKTNGGTITGGEGDLLEDGYSIVRGTGGDLLVQDTVVTGDYQTFGSLSASLSVNGLTANLLNGDQTIGTVEVFVGGAASNKTPQLQISKLSGDTGITAEWVKDTNDPPPAGSLKAVFYSSGTDRENNAVFVLSVRDAAGRTVTAGTVQASASHGTAAFLLDVAPSTVNELVILPFKNNANTTFSQVLNATLTGGVGPFAYNWTTNVGTIVSGQGTPALTLEIFSGFLPAGGTAQFSGQVTLEVIDQGNAGESISQIVPVSVLFSAQQELQIHTGTGAAAAQAATTLGAGVVDFDTVNGGGGYLAASASAVSGTGALTEVVPVTVAVTPPSFYLEFFGAGTGTEVHEFSVNPTAVPSNGKGPFQYAWSARSGEFDDPSIASPVWSRILSAPINGSSGSSGDLTVVVTDLTTGDTAEALVPVALWLYNDSPLQTHTGTGAASAQAAALNGIGSNREDIAVGTGGLYGGVAAASGAGTVTLVPLTLTGTPSPVVIERTGSGSAQSSFLFSVSLAAEVIAGVGPFTFNWLIPGSGWTKAGGYVASTISAQGYNRTLTAAADSVVTETVTIQCEVTSTSSGQVALYQCQVTLELDNTRQGQFITASPASLRALDADVIATVAATGGIPATVQVTPGSYYDAASYGGFSTVYHNFGTALSASVQNGVGPFTYAWSVAGFGAITGSGANVNYSLTGVASPGAYVSYTATITCTVTDTGRAGNPTTSTQVFVFLELNNGGLVP